MYTTDDLNDLVNELIKVLNKKKLSPKNNSSKNGTSVISFDSGLVIVGLLLGLFEVTSILIGRDRVVQIVLSSSIDN